MEEKLRWFGQWAAAWVVAQWAGISPALWTLAAFIILDAVTGIMASRYEGKPINSRDFHRGFINKAAILLLCLAAHPMELFLSQDVGITIELNMERWMPVAFAFGELISFVENLYRMDVPIPAFLVELLIKGKASVAKPATKEQMDQLRGE